MKKQLIASICLSVFIFVFTLWLTLPYENFAIAAIKGIEKQAKVSVSYSDIKSGSLSTTLSDLEIDNIPIGDVTLNYSPLKLLMGKITYSSTGVVNASGQLSADNSTIKGTVSSGLINSLITDVTFGGEVKVDAQLSMSDNTGKALAYADKATIKTPMGPMTFEKIDTDIDVKDNSIVVNKLTSKDSMELDLKGDIKVNKSNFERSMININGTFSLMNQTKEITLKGIADRLQPSIR